MTKIKSYETQKDHLRENLTKYTRKAFQMIPEFDNPRILDVGCGRGVPTMELARLSQGQITGLDINQTFLDELTKKIKDAGPSNRVRTMRCSMLEMDFPAESFDLIWAEGSIWRIGFERGLKEWRRFLTRTRLTLGTYLQRDGTAAEFCDQLGSAKGASKPLCRSLPGANFLSQLDFCLHS